MKMLTRTFVVLAVASMAASAGCTVESPNVPPLTGPSTFALALDVRATPDILVEDGMAQSVIRISARDHNNQPVANLPLRVDTVVGNTIVDFGALSARNVVTNANGDATVVFTAPRGAIPGFDAGNVVEITATPVGTNFAGSRPTSVLIRLVPRSEAQIAGAPTPSFTFTPSNPKALQLVTFNGSGSTDEDGTITRFRWTFSDGHTEEGAVVSHDFVTAGTYLVTLTVTDNQGNNASVTRAVEVSAS
jgi:PKD repeat protein